MRILLTNDDGIDAPGLSALAQVLAEGNELWTVAPATERSAASHGFTFHRSYEARRLGPRTFALQASPTDCVMYATEVLGAAFDLVVSGINPGYNIGWDMTYSGTVGAALEGLQRGIASLACSVGAAAGAHPFDRAARALAALVRSGLVSRLPAGTGLNVNVPPDPARGYRWARPGAYVHNVNSLEVRTLADGLEEVEVVQRHLVPDPAPGTDGAAVRQGFVALSLFTPGPSSPPVPDGLGAFTDGLAVPS